MCRRSNSEASGNKRASRFHQNRGPKSTRSITRVNFQTSDKDQHGRSSLWCLEVFIAFHALYALEECPLSTRELVRDVKDLKFIKH